MNERQPHNNTFIIQDTVINAYGRLTILITNNTIRQHKIVHLYVYINRLFP